MKNLILQKIQEGKNVLIVGAENSGKSHFAIYELTPLLEENNLKVAYFKNCIDLDLKTDYDVIIVDEVELLFDKNFLENKYPDSNPYYPEPYLAKVNSWHEELSKIQKPAIFIVTRNKEDEINNVLNNYKNLEWNNAPVEVLKFER